jgi:hypothetical protein
MRANNETYKSMFGSSESSEMASEDRVEVQNWTNNVRNTNNVQKKREIDLARHDPGLNRVPAGMGECCGMKAAAHPPPSSRFVACTGFKVGS